MRKNNKKGFTLAELLIVVAIIAVLVAIAIPVFTSQLEKSRESTDLSNARAAYAEVTASILDGGLNTANNTMTISGGHTATYAEALTAGAGTYTVTVAAFPIAQTQTGWTVADANVAGVAVTGTPVHTTAGSTLTFTYTVTTANAYLSGVEFS